MTSDKTARQARIFADGLEMEEALPGHPDWRITATFVRQGDQWVVSSCTIAPAGGEIPEGGLTARQLRRATLGGLTRKASRGLIGDLLTAMTPQAAGRADDDRAHPRPGRADATTRKEPGW